MVFVTLGQQSLGAFVLHVYGILLVANLPLAQFDDPLTHTLIQVTLVLAIAVLLNGVRRWPLRRADDVDGASTVDGCLTAQRPSGHHRSRAIACSTCRARLL